MLDTKLVEQRRKIVSLMISNGISTVAIASRIGVPVSTVRTDRLVLSAPNPEEVGKHYPEKRPVRKRSTGNSVMSPEDRRAAVVRMHLSGMSDADIARDLNVTRTTVGRDRMSMGFVLQSPDIAIEARRAKVKEMIDAGVDCKEIGEALGVNKMTIIRDRAALGYIPWGVVEAEDIEARRAAVKPLIESGVSCKEVGRKLGIGLMTVIRDCEALGITPSRSMKARTQVKSERQTIVLAEHEKGFSAKEIAETLGVSQMTVLRDLKTLGIEQSETQAQRRDAVLAEHGGGASVKEMADRLGVSQMTVRRDMEHLGL